MTEDELIELLQSQLPEDLSAEQIAQLRAAMKTSPRLRDALLDELVLEQGLATKYSPAPLRVEEVVERIVHRAAARRRALWRTWSLGFGAVILAAIAGIYVAAQLLKQPNPPQERTAAANPASLASAPATPTTRPGPDAAGSDDHQTPAGTAVAAGPGQQTQKPPEVSGATTTPTPTQATDAAAVAKPAPVPAWQLLELPERVNGLTLATQMAGLFTDGPKVSGRVQDRNIPLRGRWKLAEPLTDERLIRLALDDVRSFSIEAWHGQRGVEFALTNDGWAKAFLLTKAGKKNGQTVRRAAGRSAVWDYLRRGAVDLRYQDGNMVLARGDIAMLALPIAGQPNAVYMNGDCKLSLLYDRPCGPIALPKTAGARVVDTRSGGKIAWDPSELRDGKTSYGEDGSIVLQSARSRETSEIESAFPYRPGRIVEMELSGLTNQAGFFFNAQGGRRSMGWGVAEQNGVQVAASDVGNSYRRQEALNHGMVAGDDFWVRLTMGIDEITVDLSGDGTHWGRLAQTQLDDGTPMEHGVSVGVRLPRNSDKNSARVKIVRQRQMGRLGELADRQLLQRLERFGPDITGIRLFDDARKKYEAAQPRDVDPVKWRLACDVLLMRESKWTAVRRFAAKDLVEAAVANVATFGPEKVVAGATEVASLLAGNNNRDLHVWLAGVYDELGRRAFECGMRDKLADIADSWLTRIVPAGRNGWQPQTAFPERLMRLAVYDLRDRCEWRRLADLTSRLIYVQRTASGELYGDDRAGSLLRLARWGLSLAAPAVRRRGDQTLAWSADWEHPLTVRTDRETMNVLAELVAAVDANANEQAVKVLAGQTLPDGIMPIGDDGNLYQAIGVRVRQMIATNPDLAALVAERLSAIGSVRLSRALRDSDAGELESLATQFYGTPASRGALLALADRDLSMGNVLAAAGKYRRVMGQLDGPAKAACAAKYRLACAMAGQLAGEPVTSPVHFPGGQISAEDFEKMIHSLVRRGQGGSKPVVAQTPSLAPGPAHGGDIGELTTITAQRDDRNGPLPRMLGWASSGRDVVVNPRGCLSAIAGDNGKVKWRREHSPRGDPEISPPRSHPLCAGARIFVRLRGRNASLACFDRVSGEPVWTQKIDEAVLSDPVLANGWLYVATLRTNDTGQADVYLCRVSPETGQRALAAKLVTLNRDRKLLWAGRLGLAGDRLLLRCAATVVCCDLTGEVQWIRRLSYVPPDVDPRLLGETQPGDICIHNGAAILAAPCSPEVHCIDIKTGRLVWSSLQPDLGRLVGLVGNCVVLAEPGELVGLDAATGKQRWRREGPADCDAVIPAADGTVLCVRLDKAANNVKPGPDGRGADGGIRAAWWVSAADGRQAGRVSLFNAKSNEILYDVTSLYAVAREVVGLGNYDRGRGEAKLFRLRLR